MLPNPFWDFMAVVFNMVEATGIWPSSLERALVSLIPKGDDGKPENMRPITVTSAVYRLWAATRMRHVKKWQEKWMDNSQHGARSGHAVEDIYWKLAIQIEEAMMTGVPLYGFSLDYSKCFDNIPPAGHHVPIGIRVRHALQDTTTC